MNKTMLLKLKVAYALSRKIRAEREGRPNGQASANRNYFK